MKETKILVVENQKILLPNMPRILCLNTSKTMSLSVGMENDTELFNGSVAATNFQTKTKGRVGRYGN